MNVSESGERHFKNVCILWLRVIHAKSVICVVERVGKKLYKYVDSWEMNIISWASSLSCPELSWIFSRQISVIFV